VPGTLAPWNPKHRERVADVVASKRAFAGQHLVQHTPKRPHVTAPVRSAPLRLLGTHVRRGPEDHAHPSHRRASDRGRLRNVSTRQCRLQCLREAEVQHFNGSIGSQLDIRRFEIAMDDALLVRRFEGFCDLLRDGQRLVERDGAAPQPLRQVVALDKFHHEGLDALGVLQPVDGCNVRMIERGEDFRFALEPRDAFRVSRERLGEDFDGDVAIEPRVARPIHFAHPASPDSGENLVRTEARASGQWHESSLILVVARRPAKDKPARHSTRQPALPQELPADQRATERKECLVDIGPLVVANAQAAKLIEPGKWARHARRRSHVGFGPVWSPPYTARIEQLSTPARCQSRRRRQHVIPDPHSSSCGSICQGIPLRSTKTMPVRHARSETRGRPPLGRIDGIGRNGSTRSHNASGSSAAAILDHVTSPTRSGFGFCYAL
jgi:hypothetical protein